MSLICKGMRTLAVALLAGLGGLSAQAALQVVDDDGAPVLLAQPARRIISLAPHTTELLYAAGAGDRIIASVSFANYPEAAKALPRVGDAALLDLERIAALKPDLLVVWMHGSAAKQIDKLRALGVPIFHSEPKNLAQIADNLRKLGALAGTPAPAEAAALAYEQELAALRATYAGRSPVRVFHQVWSQPLLTVNDRHLISDVIRLCGGVNVFGRLDALVPPVSMEAVVAARPQVITTGVAPPSGGGQPPDGLDIWRGLKQFEPVARGQLVAVNSDLISRHTPRIAQAAKLMCEGIDKARR
ncbi:MAG: cobalamin-binding protein [Burkholderiales bacterium]